MPASAFIAGIVRDFVVFWWLAAVIGKLRGWSAFRDNLVGSFGLSPALAAWTAPAIPAAELLVAGLALAVPGPAGLLPSLLLMAAFTAVLAYRYVDHGLVRCSCFGESMRPLSGLDLLRNLLVVLAIGLCAALAPPASPTAPAAGPALLAAGLGLYACVAAIHFHDIVAMTRVR